MGIKMIVFIADFFNKGTIILIRNPNSMKDLLKTKQPIDEF